MILILHNLKNLGTKNFESLKDNSNIKSRIDIYSVPIYDSLHCTLH